MTDQVAYTIAIVASVAAVAFFAGSEIGFVASSRFRIRGLAGRGVKGARLAERLLDNPATLLSVTLVGTNIFIVLASSLTTAILHERLGAYSILVSTVVATAAILLFGEIIPKAVARADPERFLVRAAPGLSVAYYLLYPVARVTSLIALGFVRLSGCGERIDKITRDEIRALVKETAQTRFGVTPRKYAHRILDLSRLRVASVMVPIDEVVSMDEAATVGEALAIASRSGHSRYPVYKRSRENIVGILHIRDLLGVPGDSKVRVFARSAYFVPETTSVKKAIREMRGELRHLNVVTDEYGRHIGILTFEDLVEEIIGEISDEHDRVSELPIQMGQVISGSTPVAMINEELELDIPEGSYTTVAGFMLDQAGAICKVGDIIDYGDLQFHVVEVRGQRIRSVRIAQRKG